MSRSTAGDSSTSRPNASPTLGSTSASAPTSPASWASRFTSLLSRQQTSDSPRASSGAAATSVVERDVADGGGTSAAAFVDERSGGDEKGEKKEDDQDEVEQEGVVCASKAALTRVETLAEQLGGRSMGGKAVSETARVVAEEPTSTAYDPLPSRTASPSSTAATLHSASNTSATSHPALATSVPSLTATPPASVLDLSQSTEAQLQRLIDEASSTQPPMGQEKKALSPAAPVFGSRHDEEQPYHTQEEEQPAGDGQKATRRVESPRSSSAPPRSQRHHEVHVKEEYQDDKQKPAPTEAQIHDAITRALETRIEQLEQRLTEAAQVIVDLEDTAAEVEQHHKAVLARVEQHAASTRSSTPSVHSTQPDDQLRGLRRSLAALQEQHAVLRTAKERQVIDFEQQKKAFVANSNKAIEQVKKAKDDLGRQLQAQQAEATERERTHAQTKEEIGRLDQALRKAERELLESKNAQGALQAAELDLRSALEEEQRRVKLLEAELKGPSSSHENDRAETARLRAENERLLREAADTATVVDDLMETVEPLEKEKAELKSKLHEATAEGERLTAEVKMWKSRASPAFSDSPITPLNSASPAASASGTSAAHSSTFAPQTKTSTASLGTSDAKTTAPVPSTSAKPTSAADLAEQLAAGRAAISSRQQAFAAKVKSYAIATNDLTNNLALFRGPVNA